MNPAALATLLAIYALVGAAMFVAWVGERNRRGD